MVWSNRFASEEPFSDSESVDDTDQAIPDDEYDESDQVPSAPLMSLSPSDHLYRQFDYDISENAHMCSKILQEMGKTAEIDHADVEMSFITNQNQYNVAADIEADQDIPRPFSSLELLTSVHSKNFSYRTADQVADTTPTMVDACDIYLNFGSPIPEDDLLDLDQVVRML
ncbi:uncharacterized protein LOC141721851 [Apium graveolens]|uniref:uncharacterized protein LOC141721851 n=1 Tax=Apium graveolens TaxID=4045 RepID=UPI003D7A64F8